MELRGAKAALKKGGLPEVVTPHLQRLIDETGGPDGPLGRQFIARMEDENFEEGSSDPFDENLNEVAPGLVYKYKGEMDSSGVVEYAGRALWTISRYCASYCRFCFRGRIVGLPANKKTGDGTALGEKGFLSSEEIGQVFSYIEAHPDLNEIILSGGDPLVTPHPYFSEILSGLAALQKRGKLDIVRIATRLPIHDPGAISNHHFDAIKKIKNPYLMLHVNHPAELTEQTLAVLERFRRECLAVVMSQTVLLKGVNDSVETLQALFEKLAREGVRPYYLFQNDPVPWARHHTVPFQRARAIWTQLRPRLSGLAATAKFTVESEGGFGKIPVPEGDFWSVDYSKYQDFKGGSFQPGGGRSLTSSLKKQRIIWLLTEEKTLHFLCSNGSENSDHRFDRDAGAARPGCDRKKSGKV
ncbi:MAG TPA: radical SAM protein [Candidatus Gracilibacteria bacterium]|nr:radical SAM protein [Candidatus Gracilibacteria bacterium]